MITLRQQVWLVHTVTMPFTQPGRVRRVQQNAHEVSGQHRANKRLNTPLQDPIKTMFICYKVTFFIFLPYEVSNAEQCLAESALQDEDKCGARSSGMSFQEAVEGLAGALPPIWTIPVHIRFGS